MVAFWPKFLKELCLLATPFFALWFFITWLEPIPIKNNEILSSELESKLSEKVMKYIFHQENQISNPAIDSTLKIISDRLDFEKEKSLRQIKIWVIQSPNVNAITLPGGNIIVLTGLIQFCENPEELAGVLAHEAGHVKHRHIIKNISKEIGITLVTALVFSKNNDLIQEIVRKIIGSGFNRNYERDADLYAMENLKSAKINPLHLAHFLQRMEEKLGGDEINFLQTHPSNQERRAAIEQFVVTHNISTDSLKIASWKNTKSNAEKINGKESLF